MGVLTKSNHEFKFAILNKINPTITKKIKGNELLSDEDVNALAKQAEIHFLQKMMDIQQSIDMLENLEQGSLGSYTGHPGMNDLFFSLYSQAVSYERLHKEITEALKCTVR